MAKQASQNSTLGVDDFKNDARVKACIKELNDHFNAPGKDPLIVSDVLDEEGNQYVNLVQKGGGVLGIALVGYTYVLEQMGIRFLRLAGTSAGAINTSMMTVIGKKQEPKSEGVLKCLCGLDFFGLVDGHPVARKIIKSFITHEDFATKTSRWIRNIILLFVFLIIGDFVFLWLQQRIERVEIVTKVLFIATAIYVVLMGILIAYTAKLLKKLKNAGYGINPGDYFYDWIKQQLAANGVKTVKDLNDKATAPIPGVHLREDNEAGTDSLCGDVTFITSELVTENKIQFPQMCHLFRTKDDINSLQPAGFIRASMSIPIFFESYYIDKIPCDTEDVKNAWLETFGETDPPSVARFVDGGILSNFPINLFYNPDIKVPRLPTFGIDLDDTKPDNTTKHAESWTLGGYFGRLFNTIRDYYDKDFLLKNKVLQKGIGKVMLSDYNWLNFFLKDKEKIDMFAVGAAAARDFLIKFNWNEYKGNRADLHEVLKSKDITSPVVAISKAALLSKVAEPAQPQAAVNATRRASKTVVK